MKKLILSAAVVLAALTASAQLSDGSIAPDWTGTDINGITHNLYDDLDAGKAVVMDVSATWCGPCWSYHNTGALEELWEDHGPDGTDDVRVYFFEGDATTTQADLEGTGSNTQGDWVSGTGYPIIDDASINGPYDIGYYPTIYTICPSRVVVETGTISASAHFSFIEDNCAAAEFTTDASILNYSGSTAFCAGTDYTPVITIQNLGNSAEPMTSADIEVFVDGASVSTYEWTGSLTTYQTEEVVLEPIAGLTAGFEISVSITAAGDEGAENNVIAENVSVADAQDGVGNFEIEILTDNYPGETTWEVTNASGAVVAAGGPYTETGTLYEESVNLEPGCYAFTLFDSYGDGICCAFGEGSYTLRDSEGTILAEGGEFATEEQTFASMMPVGVEENVIEDFTIYPNPAADLINVAVYTALDSYDIQVLNNLGQVVLSQGFNGDTRVALDLDGLSAGSYTLRLQTDNAVGVKRFTIK